MAEHVNETAGTRARLLGAALRLFAERGYAEVGVGDVEQAVGLVPRRGALYRHFASKEALLEAAVQHHLDAVDRAGDEFDLAPEGSLTESAVALGRRILQEMDAQRDITRVMERDGDRLPELRAAFREQVSDTAYRTVAAILRRWITASSGHANHTDEDLAATAVLLTGALVNARRSAWTFDSPPLGQDDDTLVTTWAALCSATVERLARS